MDNDLINIENLDNTQNMEENLDKPKSIFVSNFSMDKLDKKSLEILNETEDDDYKFKLNDFEGPLDLLLHLIKITKIDIKDIFLSNITEQYLKLMENIDEISVEKASEFINMSATLLEIKSKMLLPHDDIREDEEDEGQRLIRQIEEYKLFKQQSEVLAKIENINSFYKKPDNSVGEFKYELPDKLSLDSLILAFKDVMKNVVIKVETVEEKKIEKDKFTVSQKIAQIKDVLLTKNRFRFKDMFDSSFSRSEVINTFLALLELLKRQYITVCQDGLYGDIDIVKNEDIESRFLEEDANEFDGENNG